MSQDFIFVDDWKIHVLLKALIKVNDVSDRIRIIEGRAFYCIFNKLLDTPVLFSDESQQAWNKFRAFLIIFICLFYN